VLNRAGRPQPRLFGSEYTCDLLASFCPSIPIITSRYGCATVFHRGHSWHLLPGEHPLCFKCQRQTVVKAALPLGPIVYVRCEECGSVWSIAERRDPLKRELLKPAPGEGVQPAQSAFGRQRYLLDQCVVDEVS
jgi:hypothetical protein